VEQLSAYDDSGEGDTSFAVDRVSEERLVDLVAQHVRRPLLLVAEGLPAEGVRAGRGRA
jgi:hypothetical protein